MEIFTDAYNPKLEDEGFIYVLDVKYVADTSNNQFDFTDDQNFSDSNSQTVVNQLVKSSNLEKPITITTLEDFKKALKKLTVSLISKLSKSYPSRISVLKQKLPKYAKQWVEDFDKIRVYVTRGDGFEVEGCLIILRQDVPFGEERENDKTTMTVLSDCVVKETL
jgi:hypothetical protein